MSESSLQVAIIGSGPSGFYTADALLKSGHAVLIDLFDRLPTPFGLVRGGVAPDHPKTKSVVAVFDRLARNPGVRFFGNVEVGRDIGIEDLRAHYDVVVLACGAGQNRPLGIPGENLPGSYHAAGFVGWYNGHPDFRDLPVDLSTDSAMVVGNGNVAIDVCRILGSPINRLARTDIAAHALDALADSRIRDIYLVGRRGPAQVKFTNAELRELGAIPGLDVHVDPLNLELSDICEAELTLPGNDIQARNVSIFREFAGRTRSSNRCIHFRFLLEPEEISGAGRVERIRLRTNRLEGQPADRQTVPTADRIMLDCGLVIASTGYWGAPMPGIQFDREKGVFSNRDGRLTDSNGVVPNMYVVGWIKRGPNGVIGTNKADGADTAEAILRDLPAILRDRPQHRSDIVHLLAARGIEFVDYDGWLRIDTLEVARGKPLGKPREKFTHIDECLDAARIAPFGA